MNRNLVLLWTGQFVSQIGDSLMQAVLLFLVLSLAPDHGSTRAGVVQLFATLPFLLLSPVAGILADRVDRRRMMLACDLARAALLLSVPFLWHAGLVSWALLAGLAFAVSTFSAGFAPARDALIPDLAPTASSLLRVNSLMQTSTQVAALVGMLLAAGLLGREAGQGRMIAMLAVDGVGFGLSFAFLFLIRVSPRSGISAAPTSIAPGLALALRSPLLRTLLVLTAIDNFFIMGPALVGSRLFILNTLHRGPREFALFEACLLAGWFLGTWLFLAFGVRFGIRKGPAILFGMLLDGATYIPFYWIRSFPLLCLAVLFHGLSIPWITVPRTSLVQEKVSPAMRAQVFSLVQLTVVGFTALSALATGWAGDRLPPPALFLYAGLGAMCGVAGILSRELREAR